MVVLDDRSIDDGEDGHNDGEWRVEADSFPFKCKNETKAAPQTYAEKMVAKTLCVCVGSVLRV